MLKNIFKNVAVVVVPAALFLIWLSHSNYSSAQTPICEAVGGAKCYYVAPDGNDSNLGTFDAPFKTFKPALTSVNPGDFIYARGGTYGMDNAMVTSVGVDGSIAPGTPNCAPGERFVDNHCCYDSYALISIKDFSGYASSHPAYSVRNGAAGNPITVKAYPGEPVFFTAPSSGGKPLNQKACSGSVNPYCSYNGFTYPGTLASFVSVVQKSYWVIQGFDMDGSYLTGSATVYIGGGSSVPGQTHDIIIQNNNIHDYVSWNGSGNNVGLIKIDRGDTGGPWNIFIRNNQLHDASDPSAIGRWTGVSDAQHYGSVTTLSREYYYGYDGGGTGYIEIAGNTIYHMPHLFMFKNPMYGPVEMHDNVMYDSDALGALNTANLHMVHNLIYGVPLSWNPVGGGYGTAITDPRLLGITGQNAIIKNNTFVGLNELMVIAGGTGHNIQNNIYFGLTARVAGAGWDTPAYIKKATSLADPIAPSSSTLRQITSDNNCFITPYTDFQFVQRFLTINSSTVIEHYSYDQAKTAFGFDPNSKIIIQSDPTKIFVNPGNHDYHLIDASICPSMGYYASASGGGDTTPPVISSINSSNITVDSAVITWLTDEPADSQVEYGLTTSYGNSSPLDGTLLTSHVITLANLGSSTLYHYRVKSKDAAGNPATSLDYTLTTISAGTPTLSVTLTASPSSGYAPLTVTLTADVAGSASGNISYAFYCNRADGATNITTDYIAKYDNTNLDPYVATNICTYNSAGTYLAKVIAERGSALPAQAQITITVSSPSTGGGGGGGGGGTTQTPSTPTISTTITAQPQKGAAPLKPTITASVSGSAQGAVNYTFFCNRSDASTNISRYNYSYDYKFNNVNETTKSVTCSYSSAGTYTAKVITERGSAPPSEARVTITVLAKTQAGAGSGGVTSSTTSQPRFKNNLSSGSKGDDVTALQSLLIKEGVYPEALVTGYYGNLTTAAVKRLQTKYNLTVSGSVDQPTLNKINQLSAQTAISQTGQVLTKNLYRGLEDPQVTLLQQLLVKEGVYREALVTGYFGPLTERAIQQFQIKYSIVSGGNPQTTGFGAVGPKTRAKLNILLNP